VYVFGLTPPVRRTSNKYRRLTTAIVPQSELRYALNGLKL
jgi:hypothetical protein